MAGKSSVLQMKLYLAEWWTLPQTFYQKATTEECVVLTSSQTHDMEDESEKQKRIRGVNKIESVKAITIGDVPEHMGCTLDTCQRNLTNAQQQLVKNSFAENKDDLGETDIIRQQTKTGQANSNKQASRRLSQAKRENHRSWSTLNTEVWCDNSIEITLSFSDFALTIESWIKLQ